MALYDLVRDAYRKTIHAMDVPRDLKRALQDHERMPLYLRNMCREIENVQKVRAKRGKPMATREQVTWLVEKMTEVFVLQVKRLGDERMISLAEKARIKAAADEQKEIEQVELGNIEGTEFEEAGFRFVDGDRPETE